MGIGRKVLVLNMALAIISVVLIFIIGQQIWNTGYLELEENDTRSNTSRAYKAWAEEVEVLSSVVSDWAPWDEMYAFAQQPQDDEFVKKNLDDSVMSNLKISMIIVANTSGEIVYTRTYNTGNDKDTSVPEEFVPHVKRINNLLPATITRENNIKGFIMLSDYPVLVSAQRIATSEFEGPSPGVLIFVRKADMDYVNQIAKRVQVEMLFIANREGTLSVNRDYWQEIINEKQIKGYQVITDIYGSRGYLLETIMSRDIYQQGQQQMNSYAILTLLFGIGISVITIVLLEKLVLSRLRKLDGFMKTVANGEDVTMRLNLPGNDEFSRNATTMNNMLDRVQDIQEKFRHLSLHDGLTGLYNRTFLEQEINNIGDKNNQSVGIISYDVNGLKIINDTLGHSIGDNMLIQTSKILTNIFVNQGKVIRMGGDEFVVLLVNINEEYIQMSCQQVQESLEQVKILREGFNLRLSVGWEYSDVQPINGEAILAMIRKADDAMYRQKLASSFDDRRLMLQEIIKMLDSRDYLNDGHGERVANMAVRLGQAVGLSDLELEKLRILGNFHDIGKVGICDHIIFKQGMLTIDERKEMERHAEIGYRIAQIIPELIPIADFILKHHEWWNGQGYPVGLKGLNIPVEDRILSIVDAYDEMTNNRSCHNAMTRSDALAELQRLSGIQFDAELVELFTQLSKHKFGK